MTSPSLRTRHALALVAWAATAPGAAAQISLPGMLTAPGMPGVPGFGALGASAAPAAPPPRRATCDSELVKGSMTVSGFGEIFMAGQGGEVVNGDLNIEHNSGFSVFSSCEEEWAPEKISQFDLVGKSMSFTVDLSKVGCACNLAFYLISSPAKARDGSLSIGKDRGGQPPYYCDANKVGGQWCPEVDIMEANNHAFQATAHKCDAAVHGHYDFCDRSGCAQNTNDKHGSFGQGSRYTINTNEPFQVETEFPENEGVLLGMRTILRQAGKKVVLAHDSCEPKYLAALSGAMKDGMSLRITYWGDSAQTMAWMDSPPCGPQQCGGRNAGNALIGNMTVSPKRSLKYYQDHGFQAHGKTKAGGDPQQQWWPAPAQAPQPANQAADVATQWVPDSSQQWQCHHYEGNQEETGWCAKAGIVGGFEYSFNAGQASPCGGCWCCKRQAKQMAVEMAWVVSSKDDPLFGQEVPASITADSKQFVTMGDHGVVQWKNSRHFVRHVRRGEVPKGDGDCKDADGNPCDMSLKEEAASLGIFLKKFSVGASRAAADSADAEARQARPSQDGLAALAGPLALGVVAAFGFAVLVLVAKRVGCALRSADDKRLHSPRSRPSHGAPSSAASSPCADLSASPMRKRAPGAIPQIGSPSPPPSAGLASVPGMPGLRRAGSSCQRLLSMQDAVA